MTSVKDCRNVSRAISGMGVHGKSLASIAITIIQMVREPHPGQTRFLFAGETGYISESQVQYYAIQLFYWMTGVRESRPTWTTFPRESWTDVDGMNPRLTSECYRLAAWAVHHEDPTIGGGTSE